MSGRTRPTLESVAARAGVSRQTVSNVINTPELVLPATRERVEEAIAALGYRPNSAARQLRTRRSQVLGLRIPAASNGISGEILDRFLHALTEEAQRAGMRIMLFAADDDAAEVVEYQNLLATLDLDGFVLTSTHHGDVRTRWLSERGVPFVTFGRPWDDTPAGAGDDDGPRPAEHAWVDIDGRAGTRAATEHLLALGHRRIGYVGWPEGSGSGDDRRAGWLEALDAAGVDARPERRTDDGVAEGARAAGELLDEDVTALVCASDSLALGATVTVRERAAAHPQAPPVAVVGFDDTPVARAVGLSSVAQPVDDVARRAVELVLAQISGDGPAPGRRQEFLTPRLVVRATSVSPR